MGANSHPTSARWRAIYRITAAVLPSLLSWLFWNSSFSTFYCLRAYGSRILENGPFVSYVRFRTSSFNVPPALNIWYGFILNGIESITGGEESAAGRILGLGLNVLLLFSLWSIIEAMAKPRIVRIRLLAYFILSVPLFSVLSHAPSPAALGLLMTVLATKAASHSKTQKACFYAGLALAADSEALPVLLMFISLSMLHHGWQGLVRGAVLGLSGVFAPALPFLISHPFVYLKTAYLFTPGARVSEWVPFAFVFRVVLQSTYTQWLLRLGRLFLSSLLIFFGVYGGSMSKMVTTLVRGLGSHDRNIDPVFAVWAGTASIFASYFIRSDVSPQEAVFSGVLLTILVMGRSRGRVARAKITRILPARWLRGGFAHVALIASNALIVLPGRFIISSAIYHGIMALIGVELLSPDWERRLCVQKKEVIDSGEIGLTPGSAKGALKTDVQQERKTVKGIRRLKVF